MAGNTSGWNRQSSANQPKVNKGGAKVPSALRGVVAGVLAVVVGVVCWFVFSHSPEAEKMATAKKQSAIKEVTPAPAPKAVTNEVKRPKKFWEVDASQTNGFTVMQMRKWKKEHRPPAGYTNRTSLTEAPPSYAIFKTSCENEIACYLTMKPGETLVGTPTYTPKQKAAMIAALDAAVIYDKDDTQEQRDLRAAVEETKKELKQRVAAGEDIGEIFLETRKEMQELAQYKHQIEDLYREFRQKEDVTIEDVDDFVKAANIQLEKKGIAPLELGVVTRRMLKEYNNHSQKKENEK